MPRAKALAAVIFWGISFVATKAALQEVHPVTLIVIRFAFGLVVLAFAVWRSRVFRFLGARDVLILAGLGALTITVHQMLQATGLVFTTASSMAWLVALSPVFTALLAWAVLSESFGVLKTAGLFVALIGAIVVVTRGRLSPETVRLPSTVGDVLALASAANWAIVSVASKPVLRRLPSTLMMAYVMLLGWVLLVPFFVSAHGWRELGHVTPGGWGAVVFLGVFCSGVAYLFWYDALEQIEASQVAAFIYLEPLVTVIAAALLLGEAVRLATFVGGLLILLGVYLVNRPAA
ncbi:MAG TPA: DMT family transporter [bacterium]|nr:DMT family transporter [bacterium]